MISRHIAVAAKKLAGKHPALVVTGPRQSGKTTFVREAFGHLRYFSMENPDDREFALSDPRGFLAQCPNGAVFDEVQRCPELFSYLQGILDQSPQMGRFVLTGSQNFQLISKITQSLAGRVAILDLLPFSFDEAYGADPPSLDETLYTGLYPPIHDRKINPSVWYRNYVRTYVQRDVSQIAKLRDLKAFRKFLRLCAHNVGGIVNFSSLAAKAGVSPNTANSWISVLEASYIIFLLQPYHTNVGKREIKAPKIYFYDTGLAANLLSIGSPNDVSRHKMRGALFENWVIVELAKAAFNRGQSPDFYFWRDHSGREIDLVVDKGGDLIPIEITSGQTLDAGKFKHLDFWIEQHKISKNGRLIHGGEATRLRRGVRVEGWKETGKVAKFLFGKKQ